ncbi:aldo/keto reductase [Lactiplantibacillus sp. WILCCON 0030]|uniref:Aldo/keto reductase n=1 Tax=Lactiplantibacillus brownii TaxID=3069269 RepID=A0ABU1A8Z4_9LACO|nr:aldo/keto reductase [Lactiplantibacillus brownii]MDQ7937390.1 aldo/keto reductase [Lactiplantibacillus brownii]
MGTVKLNNGIEMPQLGFGVFQITDLKQCEQAVIDALDAGYRLIDTAAAYQNESAVGRAIKRRGIDRKELFITSKLWVSDANYERAKKGIETSLNNLGVDYLDLYLLHQPYGDIAGAWRALEEAYTAGKIRAIGVSNFYTDQLKKLELLSDIKPVINQIEVNPWCQQNSAVDFARSEDIQIEAWAPFAEGKHDIFTNATIKKIADKYNKSNAQVTLRWLLQRGIVVIPKSVHKNRIEENSDVFDFELTNTEMAFMNELDTGKSQFFDHRDPVAIEQIFGTSLAQLK